MQERQSNRCNHETYTGGVTPQDNLKNVFHKIQITVLKDIKELEQRSSKFSYCKQIIFILMIIKIANKIVCFDVLHPVAQLTQKLIYFVCGLKNKKGC
jgi:hypothetical protein